MHNLDVIQQISVIVVTFMLLRITILAKWDNRGNKLDTSRWVMCSNGTREKE